MIPPGFVWLGVIVNLVAGLHYTYCTIQAPDGGGKRPKPNPISWGIWSLSGWLAFFGQVTEGVRNEALLTLCVAAVPTFIFVGAIASRRRYGAYAPISRTDIIFGGLAITALVAWQITDSGLVAVALSILCDALVAVPVVQQAHRDPTSDSPSIWVTGAANGIITLATIQSFTFLTAGFAIYFVGLCLLVAIFAAIARRRVGQPTNTRHQPRSPPTCATGGCVAVADPAGLAPGRLVHTAVGGPAAVPRQLAKRRRVGSVADSRSSPWRHDPGRSAGDSRICGRARRGSSRPRSSLTYPPPAGMGRDVRRRPRLGLDVRPGSG